MNTITEVASATLSLADRVKELSEILARLREKYMQADLRLELGPPRDPRVKAARRVASRQLAILTPMHRALTSLAQQGDNLSEKAKTQYIEQVAKATALVDRMVCWVDGSEADYADILSLRVPKDAKELFKDGADAAPLRDRLEAQRDKQEAEQVQARALVERFIASLTREQRTLLANYHQMTEGQARTHLTLKLQEAAYG